MKTTQFSLAGRPAGPAFTLIEMIGVMAVMAIAAAAILPVLTSQTDNALAAQETATMQSYVAALQNNIQRNHVIPSATNWVTIVAGELGMSSNNVALTARNQPRVLLIDTNGFGKMTLPYTETSAGMPDALTNSTLPRFLIVSSLGAHLPAAFTTNNVNGFLNLADFNALWNAPKGTVPNSGVWTNWTGKSTDVTVQRLNVGYLFAHLVLNDIDAAYAPYSVNGSQVLTLSPTNTQLDAYFLTATVLSLDLANTNIEATQILNMDSSWQFSGGGWRNAAAPAPLNNSAVSFYTVTNSSYMTNLTTLTNLTVVISTNTTDCCRQFNCQGFCTNRTYHACSPQQFCTEYTNFCNLYQQYVSSGCSHSSPCWSSLKTSCQNMQNNCCDLCGYYGYNYNSYNNN